MEYERKKSVEYWNDIHKSYDRKDIKIDNWLDSFNNIISDCSTPIIDLGCGSGNDTLYLLNQNKIVIPCDQSITAINNIKKNFPEISDCKCFDMLDGLLCNDNYTDLIIADLCLHYFKEKNTIKILKEIKRVLTNNGYLIMRVNSINDINHGAGTGLEVEHHLYLTEDGRLKRFFDEEDINYYFNIFDTKYIKEETMNKYKLEKKLYKCCFKNNK